MSKPLNDYLIILVAAISIFNAYNRFNRGQGQGYSQNVLHMLLAWRQFRSAADIIDDFIYLYQNINHQVYSTAEWGVGHCARVLFFKRNAIALDLTSIF